MSAPALPLPSPATRRLERALVGFLLGVLTLTFAGHGSSVDENLVLQVVDSMVNRGDLTVSNMFQALPGPDGQFYSRYGFVFPTLLVPFFLIGKGWLSLVPESLAYGGNAFMFFVLWSSVLITALAGWLFFRLCLLLECPARPAACLALGLILSTPFLPYSQTLYRLTASSVVLMFILHEILRYERRPSRSIPVILAATVALGINLREDLVIGMGWIGVYSLFNGPPRTRFVRSTALILGALIGVCLWGVHNTIRFGAVWIQNYADVHFDYPWIISLPQLLWGARRGLLLYAPLALILPIAFIRETRILGERLLALCTAMVCTYLLFYGKSDFWHGGNCWGPRHLYFLLPFAMLPGVWIYQKPARWKTICFLLACLWGLIFNLPGVYAHQGKYQSFFDSPSLWEWMRRPIETPLYVGFDDFDLWWIRMIQLEPFSLWPIAFLLLLAGTGYCGYIVWKEARAYASMKPDDD